MGYIYYSLFINLCVWAKGFDPCDPYEQRGEKPPKWCLAIRYIRTKALIFTYIFAATLAILGISVKSIVIALAIVAFYLLGDALHKKRKVFVAGQGRVFALYDERTTFADMICRIFFGKPNDTWSLTRSRNYATIYASISGLVHTLPILYIVPLSSFLALWLTGLCYGISYRLTSSLSEPWQEPVGRTLWGFFYGAGLALSLYLCQNSLLN